MRYWDKPIEKFTIDLPKSWMAMSSWIHVTGGAQGILLLTWLIDLRLNKFIHWSSYIEYILKICLDGSQLCSSETVMRRHVSISSSMGFRLINQHVDPTISIGIWVLKSASIAISLCWSVGSSYIDFTRYRHWLGLFGFSTSCCQAISFGQI